MSKKYKAFNINCDVKFKVNPDMEEKICKYWRGIYRDNISLDSLFGKADEDGYRTTQMWSLIKYIGPFTSLGLTPAIETTVYFKEKDLSDYSFDRRPPTKKQMDFIDVICRVLELREPTITNMTQAQTWISNHIDDYHTEINRIKEFENYDWSMPNGE